LTVFKDGTVRFDATNSPLTHFKPSWIGTSINKLKEIGYSHDKDGNPLTNPDQIIELRMQDVIIPYESGKYLIEICKYIDIQLAKFYGVKPFYNVKNIESFGKNQGRSTKKLCQHCKKSFKTGFNLCKRRV